MYSFGEPRKKQSIAWICYSFFERAAGMLSKLADMEVNRIE